MLTILACYSLLKNEEQALCCDNLLISCQILTTFACYSLFRIFIPFWTIILLYLVLKSDFNYRENILFSIGK